MTPLKILIIDDEQLIRWSLEMKLKAGGYKVLLAEDGETGIRLFQQHLPDIVFVDNKLPGIQGIDVISKLRAFQEETNIVFMTAYGSIETAVKAMKTGAADYINKPFNFSEIQAVIDSISEKIRLQNEVQLLRRQQKDRITFDHLVGDSQAMRSTVNLARRIAATDSTTVLLLGESGTGKDYMAKAIHNESNRKSRPFVTINCSSFAETILESELFGHEQGAFTDAKKAKKGLFEMADGGTVFLDEIGEVNLATQVKLLGVIENRTIRRMGGTHDIPIDIRIIAATNKNLESSISDRTFREDLYYRLKVFQIDMPPLRDRTGDIPVLARHFISQFNIQFNKRIEGITEGALDLLKAYGWPGNLRELRNVVERAVILETANVIGTECLPVEIAGIGARQVPEPDGSTPARTVIPAGSLSLVEMERRAILHALEETGYNQSKAARLLGITRDTLRYKVKKHHLPQGG